jgi:hypothetical protein
MAVDDPIFSINSGPAHLGDCRMNASGWRIGDREVPLFSLYLPKDFFVRY